MSGKDNGGSAYPFEGGENNNLQPCYGMTLRDYFAAMALPSLLQPAYSDIGTNFFTESDAADRAELAYAMADAMIAERAK